MSGPFFPVGYAYEQLCAVLGQMLHLLGGEVSLLIGMDTTFNMKGSVFAIRARYYINYNGMLFLLKYALDVGD